jgi:UPF0755 protein
MKRLFFPLFILVIIFFSAYLWFREGLLPVNSASRESEVFVIHSGESVDTVVRKLENQRLIRNKLVFRILISLKGIEKSIQAGNHVLSQSMTTDEIAESLTHGTLDKWVTIIEGLRVEEVGDILATSHGISASEFTEKAKQFEGYLFPDTYLIPTDTDVDSIIKMMTDNFENKVGKILTTQNTAHGLSNREVIILASLIEREAQTYQDKRIVAGILFNRIADGMPLQIDATVQFALGYSIDEKNWWRKGLTYSDLKVDSLYNTYTNTGLPPSPIASPGLDSIMAVINAKETNYYYYISDKQENMHYSTTLEEHEAKVSRYLR